MANTKKMDCVILGLLSHESLTGYEIKQRMDSALRMFWGASYGSIYPTLSSLEQQKLVTSENTSKNGREKISYTITAEGHKYLQRWLALPVEKDELRYETLLKLFFGADNGKTGTLKHIEAFEVRVKEDLAQLKAFMTILEPIKNSEEGHLYYYLTVKFGVQTYEAYLAWCEEAKRELEE